MWTRIILWVVAVAVGALFLLQAIAHPLRFSDAAILSWLGEADETSVRTEPGIIWRFPAPLHSLTVYDTRARLLNLSSETQQTADNKQLVVESFLVWRVNDPLRFFQRFGGEGSDEETHYSAAERSLQSQMRSAMSAISRYRLDELFTREYGRSKLPELEETVLATLSGGEEGNLAEWGVEAVRVGVNRIVLPETTTQDVFDRMKQTQDTLAARVRTRGLANAKTIEDTAYADAARIRSFAERRAEEIRVRGDREATPFLETLGQDEQLAVFLEQIEFLRDFYGKRTTLLLHTQNPGMSVFDPNMLDRLGDRGLPPFNGGAEAGPAAQRSSAVDGGADDAIEEDAE